jgi:isopenicillin-N N-acyltransferase-like protein
VTSSRLPRAFTSTRLPARDRGLELGERFAGEIADTADRYRRLFEARADRPFDVDVWSERAWQAIRRLAPVHADEIAGIADGAALPVERVAAINARTEILVAANPTGVNECSTVVSIPLDGPPVAVQTWDWYDAMSDNWFTWTIPFEDGRELTTVTEFGMLAKIGVNDRGVGVMLNMLHHRADLAAAERDEVGHPVHLLARAILDDADSADQAVEIASAPATSASTSLTVVDDRGSAASVELFPGGPGTVVPTEGLLVRTNHFVSEAGEEGCLASTIGVSTRVRRRHLLETFEADPPTSTQAVLAAMTHHEPEGGVCRHPITTNDPVLWHRTLATVAIDVVNRRLDVWEGGPCGERLLTEESRVESGSLREA